MKQFIVDRHTTPATPALDPVATPKVPVYDTLADAEADLNNLAEGQLVATEDTGADMALPVDVVEEDNMHAVTSNAVSESLSYSTTEQKTGGTWIDGKPIYRKVVDCGALPNSGDKFINASIPNLGYIISIKGTATSGGGYFIPLPFVARGTDINIQLMVAYEVDKIHFSTNYNLSGYTQSYIILEYTKTTD